VKNEDRFEKISREIGGECVAVRLRLLNRAVSAIYDDALRELGVKVSQVNVLTVLGLQGTATAAEVGRLLRMDKSTLSRNLGRLRARGWIEAVPGGDERSRGLRLTGAGRWLLLRAYPEWRRAQETVRELLGARGVSALSGMADRLWNEGAA
jgi:DNA-binding MarR family transcriptional regulator